MSPVFAQTTVVDAGTLHSTRPTNITKVDTKSNYIYQGVFTKDPFHCTKQLLLVFHKWFIICVKVLKRLQIHLLGSLVSRSELIFTLVHMISRDYYSAQDKLLSFSVTPDQSTQHGGKTLLPQRLQFSRLVDRFPPPFFWEQNQNDAFCTDKAIVRV